MPTDPTPLTEAIQLAIEDEVREFIRHQYPDSTEHDLRSSQVRGLIHSVARRFADLESRIEDLESERRA